MVLMTGSALAEIVTTTDGRRLEIRSDGTYQLLDAPENENLKMASQKPYFQHFAGEYGQNSIRFMPIFQNEMTKTVVGFKFKTTFRSAFGDEIFSFEGESSERIGVNKVSTAATYYFFEDNQFIADEPYDRLKIFESSGTGTISTVVTAVVFEDGEVLKRE
jgi:hypothetical protein